MRHDNADWQFLFFLQGIQNAKDTKSNSFDISRKISKYERVTSNKKIQVFSSPYIEIGQSIGILERVGAAACVRLSASNDEDLVSWIGEQNCETATGGFASMELQASSVVIFERWNWLSRYSRVFARDVATSTATTTSLRRIHGRVPYLGRVHWMRDFAALRDPSSITAGDRNYPWRVDSPVWQFCSYSDHWNFHSDRML